MSGSSSSRPFPPPELADVPFEYIVYQLRRLAPHYWTKPETADCTILVPHDIAEPRSAFSLLPFPLEVKASMSDHLRAPRKAYTEPTSHTLPRMTMKLHMDFLSAHSSLLRGLFGGASPIDLINTTITSSHETSHLRRWFAHAHAVPHLLLSSHTHPIVFLPLPDPLSFQLLIHWMYFGSITVIENALNSGTVTWEGLVRNVEYLGMPDEIRSFLNKWYRRWFLFQERAGVSERDESEESEAEDRRPFATSSPSVVDAAADADVEDEPDLEGGARRRKRTYRPNRKRERYSPTQPVSHSTIAGPSQSPRSTSP